MIYLWGPESCFPFFFFFFFRAFLSLAALRVQPLLGRSVSVSRGSSTFGPIPTHHIHLVLALTIVPIFVSAYAALTRQVCSDCDNLVTATDSLLLLPAFPRRRLWDVMLLFSKDPERALGPGKNEVTVPVK